jgi:hypothetical protein
MSAIISGLTTMFAVSAAVLALGAAIAWRARTARPQGHTTEVPISLRGTNLGFSSTGDPARWTLNLLVGSANSTGDTWDTGVRSLRVTVKSEMVIDAAMRGMDLLGEVKLGLSVDPAGVYEVLALDPVHV